jgi:xanthine dehydrogenase large subunit
VGEPPLMLATAVWNALCDATNLTQLDLPATPEVVLMALEKARKKQG